MWPVPWLVLHAVRAGKVTPFPSLQKVKVWGNCHATWEQKERFGVVSREISEGINWLCSICHQNDFGFGNFILNVIYFFFFFLLIFFFFLFFQPFNFFFYRPQLCSTRHSLLRLLTSPKSANSLRKMFTDHHILIQSILPKNISRSGCNLNSQWLSGLF